MDLEQARERIAEQEAREREEAIAAETVRIADRTAAAEQQSRRAKERFRVETLECQEVLTALRASLEELEDLTDDAMYRCGAAGGRSMEGGSTIATHQVPESLRAGIAAAGDRLNRLEEDEARRQVESGETVGASARQPDIEEPSAGQPDTEGPDVEEGDDNAAADPLSG